MTLVCAAGWLHEVQWDLQWVLCTAFWSMDMTGVYACLFEAVCDVTTVPSHLKYLCQLKLMKRDTDDLFFIQKWDFGATWSVLLWKTLSRNFSVVSFYFAEMCHFFFHANHALPIDMQHFDWPSCKTMQMSLVSPLSRDVTHLIMPGCEEMMRPQVHLHSRLRLRSFSCWLKPQTYQYTDYTEHILIWAVFEL